ncbi:MAG: threonine/serine dehydratase [Vulcanimicrobiota bacterium]
MKLDLDDIEAARVALPDSVVLTPVLHGPLGIWCKCENLQRTGAYKIRAAYTALQRLTAEQRRAGVALSSSGNFARAMATAARDLELQATLVMMESTDPYKVEWTRSMGGRIVFCEDRYEARYETLAELAQQGLTVIDHRDHPDVIAGHATIGLELLDQCPRMTEVVIPASTGGLLAGVALAVKSLRPDVKVYGVQPSGSRACVESFRLGQMVCVQTDTICDALTASSPGRLPFELMQRWVDDVIEVSEEAVRLAVKTFATEAKLVVEPGGAVGLAALLERRLPTRPGTVLLVSGGNISPERLAEILA